MVEFKVVVNNPKDGKSYQVPVTGQHANILVRKRIGDEVDGMFLGLPGYKVKITGGCDKDGFPMRPDFPSSARKKILVSAGLGFKPARAGTRKKKAFRGNEISPNTLQINAKIVESGPKPVAELLTAAPEKK